MTTGTKGLNLIKLFECNNKPLLKAVLLAGEKYYTIGYGHSYDTSVKAGTVWTKAQCEAQLKKDLKKFEAYVDKYVPIKLNQNQFDALVSYVYNRGPGGLKQLAANSKTASDYAKNIVVYWGTATRYKTGLVRRRKAEQALFLTSCYPRLNSTGDDVKTMQHRLVLCGWTLTADGVWGAKTEAAVREYQKKAGLTVDGIYGPKTVLKLVQDSVCAYAKTLAAYLVKYKWHYKGGDYAAKSTFSATKSLSKPGCSCAHFVSWVLQEVGLLTTGKILSHSKAGAGTGAKSITNANQLIGCSVIYPNATIAEYKAKLCVGDVLVHDSSIGVWIGDGKILTGREGQPINSSKAYVDLCVKSGYEWKRDVLAIVRVS